MSDYRYMRLTRTIKNSTHDRRRRYGIEATAEFAEDSLWHVLEGGPGEKDVMYRGAVGRGNDYVGWFHPDYATLRAALEDREPTNNEILHEYGLSAEEVIEEIDSNIVQLAAVALLEYAKQKEGK